MSSGSRRLLFCRMFCLTKQLVVVLFKFFNVSFFLLCQRSFQLLALYLLFLSKEMIIIFFDFLYVSLLFLQTSSCWQLWFRFATRGSRAQKRKIAFQATLRAKLNVTGVKTRRRCNHRAILFAAIEDHAHNTRLLFALLVQLLNRKPRSAGSSA